MDRAKRLYRRTELDVNTQSGGIGACNLRARILLACFLRAGRHYLCRCRGHGKQQRPFCMIHEQAACKFTGRLFSV